jgi:hypothetical protein
MPIAGRHVRRLAAQPCCRFSRKWTRIHGNDYLSDHFRVFAFIRGDLKTTRPRCLRSEATSRENQFLDFPKIRLMGWLKEPAFLIYECIEEEERLGTVSPRRSSVSCETERFDLSGSPRWSRPRSQGQSRRRNLVTAEAGSLRHDFTTPQLFSETIAEACCQPGTGRRPITEISRCGRSPDRATPTDRRSPGACARAWRPNGRRRGSVRRPATTAVRLASPGGRFDETSELPLASSLRRVAASWRVVSG